MTYTSSVTYSGMGNQNSQRLKEIQENDNAKELTDEATRKQFEEDVKFLNDFSQNFRK